MGRLEEALSEKDGPLTFFGLYRREEGLGNWDLLISAPCLSDDRKESLDLILRRINEVLTPEALLPISSIIVMRPNEPAALNLPPSFRVEHGRVHVRNVTENGMAITDAYLITCDPDAIRSATAAIEDPSSRGHKRAERPAPQAVSRRRPIATG